MKTILVTGGSGFIGGVTCRYLYNAGYSVINVDLIERSQTGVVQYVTNVNSKLTNKLIKQHNPDAVIHFAADHSVPKSIKDPVGTYTNNVMNTITLLNTCVEHNIKNFIFSSSSSVYGNIEILGKGDGMRRFSESSLIDPMTPYSKSKAMIETILEDYSNAYDLNYTALRYFNAAGSHKGKLGYKIDPPEHLLPILVDCAYTGKEFTIFGTDYDTPCGTCVRDYTHVDDIAKAHILAAEYLFEGNKSTIVNIGSQQPKGILQVISEIEKQTDKYIHNIKGPRRKGDMVYTFANNTKAKALFNWDPSKTFTNIIEDEIIWYKHTHHTK